MKTKELVIGIVIGIAAGMILGFSLKPYSITAGSQDTTFKINGLTGRTWVFHYDLGQWVEVPNR